MFFVDAVDAGQKFLRVNSSIKRFARLHAVIATTARSRKFFAEVFQERRAPAVAGFGVMNHVAQLLVRDALLAFALLFNETPLLHYVARTEKEHAIAGQTAAPGPH